MNHYDQYRADEDRSATEHLLASLIPDSPAALVPSGSDTASPAAPEPIPSVAALLDMARRQGALEARLDASAAKVYVPTPLPSAPEPGVAAPIVPRWAVGTAVASVGIGGGAFLVSLAVPAIAAGAAALVAGAAAALPFIVVGGVAIACMTGRRKSASGPLSITQTMTQTITNEIRMGK